MLPKVAVRLAVVVADLVAMNNDLQQYLEKVAPLGNQISEERKIELGRLSSFIKEQLTDKGNAQLDFICTHNSRRSHLTQIWAQIAAYHHGLNIQCYSGGTEATRIYASTIKALEKAGIDMVKLSDSENPIYSVRYNDTAAPLIAFSKTFDHPMNPSEGYAAIMTCGHAEENCPYIPTAAARIAITYVDPKHSDGSPEESQVYGETCKLIATEMFYVMSQV